MKACHELDATWSHKKDEPTDTVYSTLNGKICMGNGKICMGNVTLLSHIHPKISEHCWQWLWSLMLYILCCSNYVHLSFIYITLVWYLFKFVFNLHRFWQSCYVLWRWFIVSVGLELRTLTLNDLFCLAMFWSWWQIGCILLLHVFLWHYNVLPWISGSCQFKCAFCVCLVFLFIIVSELSCLSLGLINCVASHCCCLFLTILIMSCPYKHSVATLIISFQCVFIVWSPCCVYM